MIRLSGLSVVAGTIAVIAAAKPSPWSGLVTIVGLYLYGLGFYGFGLLHRRGGNVVYDEYRGVEADRIRRQLHEAEAKAADESKGSSYQAYWSKRVIELDAQLTKKLRTD